MLLYSIILFVFLNLPKMINLLPILKQLPHLLFNHNSLFIEYILQEESCLSLECYYVSHRAGG